MSDIRRRTRGAERCAMTCAPPLSIDATLCDECNAPSVTRWCSAGCELLAMQRQRRLKDLGGERKTAPAVKHDSGKDPWDLLPTKAVRAVVQVLAFGARKYAPGAWRHVPDARRRYYAAALRHLTAWWEGETHDAESGLPHLAHACCCVVFLLDAEVGEVVEANPSPPGA